MKVEEYELRLKDGRLVHWEGTSGESAARRYADSHPGSVVIAWRFPRYGLHVGLPKIADNR